MGGGPEPGEPAEEVRWPLREETDDMEEYLAAISVCLGALLFGRLMTWVPGGAEEQKVRVLPTGARKNYRLRRPPRRVPRPQISD